MFSHSLSSTSLCEINFTLFVVYSYLEQKRDALIIKGRVFHALYKLKQLHTLRVIV